MTLPCKVLLCMFAASLTFSIQRTGSSKPVGTGNRCVRLLRNLLKNPPKNTKIAINIGLSKARHTCDEGFVLTGVTVRTCRGGRWREKKDPKCLEPVSCGKPDDIPHAKYTGSSFKFNDKLRYVCEDGYTLKGPRRRKCGEGGKWSKAPKCLGPCGKPEDIPHAKVEGSSYDFKDTLSYSCEKGYALDGPVDRTCREDGTWSNAPTCSRIQCSNPGNLTLQNGNVTTSDPGYFYGATLLYECNEGYELNRPGTLICYEHGWKPRRAPYCIEKACPDPGRPERGYRYGHLTVGSTMRFFCQSGFKLHGSKERTCLDNKEWSGSLTTCQNGKTYCPVLGTPISGSKYGSRYNEGDIVKFQCKPGFVLKGSAIRKCMENGTWNGTEAICKDKIEDSYEDVNTTAFNLRKNLIDSLLDYTTNDKTNVSMDVRGRAIFTNDESGLDLVFVLDASSSVKRANFELGLDFLKRLVSFIGNTSRADKMRIAAVSYGTEAHLQFNLGDADLDTIDKKIKAIEAIQYMGGATATTDALKLVRDVVEPQARIDSDRVMIFITDGKSNLGEPPTKIANELHKMYHYEVYVIGLGKDIDRDELLQIATNDKRHVVHLRDQRDLDKALERAVDTSIDYSPCGESPANLRARVVGGDDSKRGWWPWQIAIYRISVKDDKVKTLFHCGGALISRQLVLTAAHCFYRKEGGKWRPYKIPGGYFIKAGVHNFTRKEDSEQRMRIEKITTHEKYNPDSFLNDIALLKLEQPLELKPFVRTVCLPKKNEGDLAIQDKHGIATGWGVTTALKFGERGKSSKLLQHSSFKIQNDQLCSDKAKPYSINSTVTFCAGDGQGTKDTCHGDSGGAFVREAQRGGDKRWAWVATGVVSWGIGCAQKDNYGYYTRVYPFIDWIKKAMDKKGGKVEIRDKPTNTSDHISDNFPCGKSPADLRARVVGGNISRRGWWPWQIAIHRISITDGTIKEPFHCGGALIYRQWVLTAAHCFYRKIKGNWRSFTRTPRRYVIKAGVHSLTRKEDSEQRMQIKKIIAHDQYNPETFQNDIALLQLDQPLELKRFVRTVCLPKKNEGDLAIRDKQGIGTGWGVTRPLLYGGSYTSKDYSRVLQHASLKIQSDQLCLVTAKPHFINSTVTFCAGDGQGKKDTCQGDSGGAFVREAQRGDHNRWAWVATGVVSWGKGCAQEGQYGYYTRVYPFIDWIKKTIAINERKENKE